MAERLAERAALGLELLAGLAVLLPRLRELAAVIADLREPRFAIGDLQADDAPRRRDPFLAVVGDRLRRVVEAALRLAELVRHVAHVGDAFAVELRPVVERADDVRARPGLHRRGDARLDVVAVDGLDVELEAERLLALRRDLLAQQLVGSGDEVVPAQPVQRGALRERGRPAGGEDRRHAAAPGRERAGAGQLEKFSSIDASHGPFLPGDVW